MQDSIVELDKLNDFNERCNKHLATLTAFQAFWRDAIHHGIEVPWDAYYGTSRYANIAQHLYNSDNGQNELDVEGTQKQFARVVKWARRNGWTVEKKYNDDEFQIKISGIHDPIRNMEFYSTRQVICKRVQTGTKVVPATDAHEEPVYEYMCDKVAFLSVNTD